MPREQGPATAELVRERARADAAVVRAEEKPGATSRPPCPARAGPRTPPTSGTPSPPAGRHTPGRPTRPPWTRCTQFVGAATEARHRVLGPDAPETLASRIRLGDAHWAAGDRPEAVACWKAALADCERALGPDHPLSQVALVDLRRALPQAT